MIDPETEDDEFKLNQFVIESGRGGKSITVYYTENGLHHKGYFCKALKQKPGEKDKYTYPILCHMSRKKAREAKCQHRFR